jgi:hypothetical protein
VLHPILNCTSAVLRCVCVCVWRWYINKPVTILEISHLTAFDIKLDSINSVYRFVRALQESNCASATSPIRLWVDHTQLSPRDRAGLWSCSYCSLQAH